MLHYLSKDKSLLQKSFGAPWSMTGWFWPLLCATVPAGREHEPIFASGADVRWRHVMWKK
jgi:hypothetical protein